MMPLPLPRRWRSALRASGILAAVSLLLAACLSAGEPAETPAKTAVVDGSESAPDAPQETAVRTAQVFDTEAYKGKLTIRYFYLDGENLAGDSFLIVSPEGKTMLIDAGVPEAGAQVVDYLRKLNIGKLDYALNTHPHIDHIGGFAAVAKEIDIGTFYMENLPYPKSSAYTNAMAELDAKKVPKKTLQEGDAFMLGEQVRFEVLNPPEEALPDAVKTFSAQEINDYSMVLKMTYGDRTFLFTADVYKRREIELAGSGLRDKLKSDMMDAPHHGNESTSSSTAFIEAVSPRIVIMSQNIFQSPNLKERLEKNGTEVYSTGLHGNILLHSDGRTIEVLTEKDWQPAGAPAAR